MELSVKEYGVNRTRSRLRGGKITRVNTVELSNTVNGNLGPHEV